MKDSEKMVEIEKEARKYHRIGSSYPLYFENNPRVYYDNYEDILSKKNEEIVIDEIGIVEIISKSYLLGSRTLIRKLRRLPWLSIPTENGPEFIDIPKHSVRLESIESIASELKNLLRLEVLGFLNGKKNVCILLSGGLDSRIVAGILKELQMSGDYSGDVIGCTWGIPDCRDVVYSKMVCERFKWDFVHLELTSEDLLSNFELSALNGAEVSPLHFHTIKRVSQIEGIDCYLACTYGDSIGRGEYSGKNVRKLPPTLPRVLDLFGILKRDVVKHTREAILEDAYDYRIRLRSSHKEYQYREIEQQSHYLRRKLQACLNILNTRERPLFQAFTSPRIVEFVWSLDPTLRNNKAYIEILGSLPEDIGKIAWARTGKVLGTPTEELSPYSKEFHQYGKWLRSDLKEFVLENVLSEEIEAIGTFDMCSLEKLSRIWQRSNNVSCNRLDELFSWIAVLAQMKKLLSAKDSGQDYGLLLGPVRNLLKLNYWKAYTFARNRMRE